MTATAVVGSAAEDTTPSEREAPARFAWWHPRSADLGRRAEARRQHARRNDLWVRPTAGEAPIIASVREQYEELSAALQAFIDNDINSDIQTEVTEAQAKLLSLGITAGASQSGELVHKAIQAAAARRPATAPSAGGSTLHPPNMASAPPQTLRAHSENSHRSIARA